MSKKVLILSSSPRRNGNSDHLCNEFMRGAAEAGHQVEKILLKDKHINYCTGCSVCSMYGKPCPQKDDAAEVRGGFECGMTFVNYQDFREGDVVEAYELVEEKRTL